MAETENGRRPVVVVDDLHVVDLTARARLGERHHV